MFIFRGCISEDTFCMDPSTHLLRMVSWNLNDLCASVRWWRTPVAHHLRKWRWIPTNFIRAKVESTHIGESSSFQFLCNGSYKPLLLELMTIPLPQETSCCRSKGGFTHGTLRYCSIVCSNGKRDHCATIFVGVNLNGNLGVSSLTKNNSSKTRLISNIQCVGNAW